MKMTTKINKKAATPLCGGLGAAPPPRDGNCESNFLANKRKYTIILLLCVTFVSVLFSLPRRESKPSEAGYTLRYNIPRNMPTVANNYALYYEPTTRVTALEYARNFKISTNPVECDDAFTFENEAGILRVYRHIPKLIYERYPNISMSNNDVAWECCIYQSITIMEEYNLVLTGEPFALNESENNKNITVKFIDSIEDLKNHALNNTVTLDTEGNLVAIEYFFVELELLGSCSIKSILEAFNELPIHDGENIDITNVQLVYIYANSIIQPGYLFSGEDSDGEYFSILVRASCH